MSKWPTALFLLSLLTTCVPLRAQQSFAIAHDPAPDTQAPTQNLETVIDSRGSHIMGLLLLASGTQAHGTVILLHGFPGYEQNMDLAQALRRDGWNVLAMHYRGSWGSEGTFSFTNCMEDVGTMLAYVSEPANSAKFHVDLRRIVVIGHSMGGFMAVAALAQHPQIAAGVVITEGSPVVDGPGYFGKDSDPADYAPLAGTSPAALQREGAETLGGLVLRSTGRKNRPASDPRHLRQRRTACLERKARNRSYPRRVPSDLLAHGHGSRLQRSSHRA
jgi:pimeloyl-ACP methyl ester carboxylesterase